MSVAPRVRDYLSRQNIEYKIIHHAYSEGAIQTAIAAQVPLANMAKAVILEDHEGRHLMAVIPAANKLEVKKLSNIVERSLHFAPEKEVWEMFADCSRGAIPALGPAYHMETIYDDSLSNLNELYMEGGDHEDILSFDHTQFENLTAGHPHAEMSVAMGFSHKQDGIVS